MERMLARAMGWRSFHEVLSRKSLRPFREVFDTITSRDQISTEVESAMKVATSVRASVAAAPSGTFFRARDFAGTDRALETALSRMAATGDLLRVRRGLYWKGVSTRFGMAPPSTLDIALAIGGPGSGPTGIAAAHYLGLSTQVPSTVRVAVPHRAPAATREATFCVRPFSRREQRLTPVEVAVLELLRDPAPIEETWDRAAAHIRDLAATGSIRAERIATAVRTEANVAARRRWAKVVD